MTDSVTKDDIDKFYKEMLTDEGVNPDLTIYSDGEVFSVRLPGGICTGILGLMNYLNVSSGLNTFMKINYNGIILSQEETKKFLYQYKPL